MRRRTGRSLPTRVRRRRIEAETVPPLPCTAVSGHAPSIGGGAGDQRGAGTLPQVLTKRPGPVPLHPWLRDHDPVRGAEPPPAPRQRAAPHEPVCLLALMADARRIGADGRYGTKVQRRSLAPAGRLRQKRRVRGWTFVRGG